MISKRYFFIFLSTIFFLLGCQQDKPHERAEMTRPHDPWVFRSVLDSMPRMLTIALHEDLWAAYSTEDCALYKVWKGYVSLEGAVYNTHHGPQPLSMGDAYVLNEISMPWKVVAEEADQTNSVRYAGHRFVDGHVQLIYQIESKQGHIISVYEQPEYLLSESGQVGFERTFTVENLPPGNEIIHASTIQSIASKTNVKSNVEVRFVGEQNLTVGKMNVMQATLRLPVQSEQPSTLATYFVGKPTIKNPRRQQVEEEEDLPLGYRLIAQNDCKTCHNVNVKTIGPAYVDIAEKYPTADQTILMLANKILSGGAGIWGAQVMTAHPELAESDAKEMVRYILSLDTDDTGASDEGVSVPKNEYFTAVSEEGVQFIPGAATKVFDIPKSTSKLPVIPTSRKPKMAGVMPNFANLSGAEFKELEDQFAMHIDGYLYADQEGEYSIRLWSDDGSKMMIHGQEIINNDGLHGAGAEEATIGLNKGYHPIRIEYFEGSGGQFLSLNWKPPGGGTFGVVPPEALYHTIGQQSADRGLKLPMSEIRKVPGDGYNVPGVHPAYDLSQARPADLLPKVGGMDFLPDGRLAVCTWDPSGAVYLIENAQTGDPSQMSYKRIAAGLAEPLGLKVVDGDIYVLQKQELTRLIDHDGDDVIDEYRLVSNNWKTSANFHEFAFGLEYMDGFFYGTLATAIMPGGASANPQIEDRGKVIKISKEDGSVEFVAHGLRTPNGIGIGVDGEIFVCDNQGDWLPSSKVIHVQKGAWYGSRSVDFEGTANLTETPPMLWLPQDEIGNSPGTPLYINDGPYKGQMIHGEVTHGGVKRDFVEQVNGQYQGAVFRFIQGLEAGVNRMVWGPDGALYVGGIGNPGNWQHSGTLWYGLQRLKYNGNSAFEMLAIRARTNGVEIEFTEPLREGKGWSKSDYQVQQWKYVPTIEYGGPKVDLKNLNITSVNISDDRKKVFLELNGMRSGHMVYVHILAPFVSEQNHGLWSTEGWYTMNQIPANSPGFKSNPSYKVADNTLSPSQKAQGWELLFDGKTTGDWKKYGTDEIGSSWKVADGALYLETKINDEGRSFAPDGGDIITANEYENFEFEMEWKISNCGNSGIFFSVVESPDYDEAWLTAPEMQILDNTCHPDARFPTHRAGDLYDMIECESVTVRPAGNWNQVRIIKNNGKVEQWLNGQKVVEYEMYTEEWDAMVAKSKFKDLPAFAKSKKGKIALQDHGDGIWFKNLKIRELE